jgi:hypothetical protein
MDDNVLLVEDNPAEAQTLIEALVSNYLFDRYQRSAMKKGTFSQER